MDVVSMNATSKRSFVEIGLLVSSEEPEPETSSKAGWAPSLPDPVYSLNAEEPIDMVLFLLVGGASCLLAVLLVSVIVSGGRRRTISTMVMGTCVVFSGFAVAFGILDCSWLVGEIFDLRCAFARTTTSFPRTFDSGDLRVTIGLFSSNLTYRGKKDGKDYYYRETFDLRVPGEMTPSGYFMGPGSLHYKSLVRGLPDPMLTMSEYFGSEPYRKSVIRPGVIANLMLWSEAFFLVGGTLLLVTAPGFGVRALLLNAVLFALTNIFYILLSPICPVASLWGSPIRFKIYVSGILLRFRFGRTFWVVTAASLLNLLTFLAVKIFEACGPCNSISTFLEVDYDTDFNPKRRELRKQLWEKAADEEGRQDCTRLEFRNNRIVQVSPPGRVRVDSTKDWPPLSESTFLSLLAQVKNADVEVMDEQVRKQLLQMPRSEMPEDLDNILEKLLASRRAEEATNSKSSKKDTPVKLEHLTQLFVGLKLPPDHNKSSSGSFEPKSPTSNIVPAFAKSGCSDDSNYWSNNSACTVSDRLALKIEEAPSPISPSSCVASNFSSVQGSNQISRYTANFSSLTSTPEILSEVRPKRPINMGTRSLHRKRRRSFSTSSSFPEVQYQAVSPCSQTSDQQIGRSLASASGAERGPAVAADCLGTESNGKAPEKNKIVEEITYYL